MPERTVMKQILLLIFFLLASTAFSKKLLWTSEFGGDNSNGALISYDRDKGSTKAQLSLGGNPLYGFNLILDGEANSLDYSGGLTLGTDGNYYGVSSKASGIASFVQWNFATQQQGIFYRYNPTTGKTEVLHSFVGKQEWHSGFVIPSEAFNNDLSEPGYAVLETAPGVFYGQALEGGVSGHGGVWKFDANTGSYSVIGSFRDPSNDIGYNPVTKLIKGDGNNIYGLCKNNSNATSNSLGYLYKIDTSTDQISYVNSLNAAGWVMDHPHGQMVYNASTNTIYGTKDYFDTFSKWGGGVWSYNLSTDTQKNEWTILYSELATLGSLATGIIEANDGKMYVTTRSGGAHDKGTIIQYTPVGGTYLKVFDFPADFSRASGTGMLVQGSKIIGTSDFNQNNAQVWSYDYITGSFEVLVSGSVTDPTSPGWNIENGILVDNGNVIGRTRNGSEGGAGSIFSHNIATGVNSILKSNGSREGRAIIGELTQLNDSIFVGYIGKGGPNATGDPVAQDENGSLALFNVLAGTVDHLASPFAAFNDLDYAQNNWTNRPLRASNGKLYYTSYSDVGYRHSYRLMEHDLTNPAQYIAQYGVTETSFIPPGLIELPGAKIVMAMGNHVEVYDIQSKTVTSFSNTHSTDQYGHMTDNIILSSNGKIYGMTDASNRGTAAGEGRSIIYSLDTATFALQVEHVFDSLVRTTNSALTEYKGKLYGSTNFLGANNEGHLFSYDMSSGAYSIEHSFDKDQDGGGFSAGWTLLNDTLYSTSRTGGAKGYGTLVAFDLASSTLSTLEHLTLENGRSFRGTPVVWDDSFIITLPKTVTPLADIQVQENESPLPTVALKGRYTDDKDLTALTYTVTSSDPTLVTPTVSAGDTLSFALGSDLSGVADIILSIGNSDGGVIYDTLTFTVLPFTGPPFLLAAIGDIRIGENHKDSILGNTGSLFHNPQQDAMTFSAVSSDSALFTASLNTSGDITLQLVPDVYGLGELILSATNSAGSIYDTVSITVLDADSLPVFIGDTLPDVITTVDTIVVNLNNVFKDPHGGKLTYTLTSADLTVVTPTITVRNELQLLVGKEGTTNVTVTALNSTNHHLVDQIQVRVVDDFHQVAFLPDITIASDTTIQQVDALFKDKLGLPITLSTASSDSSLIIPAIVQGELDLIIQDTTQSDRVTVWLYSSNGVDTLTDTMTVKVLGTFDDSDQEFIYDFGQILADTVFMLKAYPNPAPPSAQALTLYSSNTKSKRAEVRVFSSAGKVIEQGDATKVDDGFIYSWKLGKQAHVPASSYYAIIIYYNNQGVVTGFDRTMVGITK